MHDNSHSLYAYYMITVKTESANCLPLKTTENHVVCLQTAIVICKIINVSKAFPSKERASKSRCCGMAHMFLFLFSVLFNLALQVLFIGLG